MNTYVRHILFPSNDKCDDQLLDRWDALGLLKMEAIVKVETTTEEFEGETYITHIYRPVKLP